MRKETIKIRENLICDLWKKEKSRLAMVDIAEIFGVSTANVYRILRKEYNKKNYVLWDRSD